MRGLKSSFFFSQCGAGDGWKKKEMLSSFFLSVQLYLDKTVCGVNRTWDSMGYDDIVLEEESRFFVVFLSWTFTS